MRIWGHWQNLRSGAAAWVNGRAWLHFSPPDSYAFHVEWSHGRKGLTDFRLVWASAGWTNWLLSIGFLGCGWYLGAGEMPNICRRETGVYLFGDHFNLMLFHLDGNGMRSDSGWRWSCFLMDKVFGRPKYTQGEKVFHDVYVPMRERVYNGRCALHVDTWTRSRWFTKRLARATIDMNTDEQIPVPGKGENAWDCGQDATWSITLPASTVAEAVGGLVESVLRTRERHGGSVNWLPGAREVAHG